MLKFVPVITLVVLSAASQFASANADCQWSTQNTTSVLKMDSFFGDVLKLPPLISEANQCSPYGDESVTCTGYVICVDTLGNQPDEMVMLACAGKKYNGVWKCPTGNECYDDTTTVPEQMASLPDSNSSNGGDEEESEAESEGFLAR